MPDRDAPRGARVNFLTGGGTICAGPSRVVPIDRVERVVPGRGAAW